MPLIRPKARLIFVQIAAFFASAHANAAPAPAELQARANQFIVANKMEEARSSLEAAIAADPRCASCLYNLGVVEARSGQAGKALGHWRKAVNLSPGYEAPRHAIEWQFKKLDRQDIAHESDAWEEFRSTVLAPVGMWVFGWIAALALAMTAWLGVDWLERRSRSAEENEGVPLTAFPVWAAASAAIFVAAASLQIAKLVDADVERATIVAKKVEALSAPDSGSAPLFDLFEGLEVVVRQSQNGYTQVVYPGAASGWVPRGSIYVTN